MPTRASLLAFLLALAAVTTASADEQSDCAAAAGTYVIGKVVRGPHFARGHRFKGVELSHTQFTVSSLDDGAHELVVVDNVFAAGYDDAGEGVPAPLNGIRPGDTIEACGQPFSGGVHWTHTNCGDQPTPKDPNGWLKVVSAEGRPGPNLEDSTEYCHLWGGKRRHGR
jgi:hypothetical protein